MRFAAFLLVGMAMLGGCGYSLEIFKAEETSEAPDPLTLLGRDLRQLKADQRVSVFDLKNEQKALEERTRIEVERILAGLRVQIQNDLSVLEKKREAGVLSLRKRDADFGEQIAEIELQLRLMGGSIEEEINRYKDDSEQINDHALRELGNINRLLAAGDKEKKSSIKVLQDQLNAEKHQREALKKTFDKVLFSQVKSSEQAREGLKDQIEQINAENIESSASSGEQIKALKQLSTQVNELIEKLLPAVNQLAERLDNQEEQFDSLKREINIKALNRQVTALTDTIDVQRRSLEMLGNTLTSEVDKQKLLLQKTIERLQPLESK